MESNQVKTDLVTKQPEGGCTLVPVEPGPWMGEQKNQNMQRLGNRIARCVSAVINGQVAPAVSGHDRCSADDSSRLLRYTATGSRHFVGQDAERLRQIPGNPGRASVRATHFGNSPAASLVRLRR